MTDCHGSHRYFVADVAVVPSEGAVSVIIVCTCCGRNEITTHKVASLGSEIKLEKGK